MTKTYFVEKTTRAFDFQQPTQMEFWRNANMLTDFHFPWDKDLTTKMTVRALHDANTLFLFCEVTDENIQIFIDQNKKLEVIESDRVEFFFRINSKMERYYGLEIDPMGRVLDYTASYYRKFNYKWGWPAEDIKVNSNFTQYGYYVVIHITKRSLDLFQLIDNNKLQVGIFRGKCVGYENKKANMKWISWINPDTPTPDFHVPSAFGIFELVKLAN